MRSLADLIEAMILKTELLAEAINFRSLIEKVGLDKL